MKATIRLFLVHAFLVNSYGMCQQPPAESQESAAVQSYIIQAVLVNHPVEISLSEAVRHLHPRPFTVQLRELHNERAATGNAVQPAPPAAVAAARQRQNRNEEGPSSAAVLPEPWRPIAAPDAVRQSYPRSETLQPLAEVATVSNVQIVTRRGEGAAVEVMAENSFDYLGVDPGSEGRFVKRTTQPKRIGFSVQATVAPAAEPGRILIKPVILRQVAMVGRQSVAGLRIDAGEPIFVEQTVETELYSTLGHWDAISLPVSNNMVPVLLLRVTELPAPSRDSAP